MFVEHLKRAVQKSVANTGFEPAVRRFWNKIAPHAVGYDVLTTRVLGRVLTPGSNCIDVGCHVGVILEEMLAVAPEGRHHAFEPLPHYADFLRKKYRHNPHVTVHDEALSDQEGTVDFVYNRDHPAYSGLQAREYPSDHDHIQKIKVKTRRLDDLIEPDQKIDLIKIDVEGAELGVMRGASKIIDHHKPTLVFEHGLGASEFYRTRPEDVFDLLSQLGLRIYLLDEFLDRKLPLSKDHFAEQFYRRLNHYFVAVP